MTRTINYCTLKMSKLKSKLLFFSHSFSDSLRLKYFLCWRVDMMRGVLFCSLDVVLFGICVLITLWSYTCLFDVALLENRAAQQQKMARGSKFRI